MKRMGFPDVRIQVFPDYNSYLVDSHWDISDAFIKLNIRESLYGILNATLIVSDENNVIEQHDDLVFKVTDKNVVDNTITEYIFGTTHNDLTILQDGSPVRQYNLVPYHDRIERRFSKKLTNSASESIDIMLDDLYIGYELLKPEIEGIETYLPSAVWVKNFQKYLEFVSHKAISSENDSFIFCYYKDGKIVLEDFETMMLKEPLKCLVVEEELVGQLGNLFGDIVPVFKYEFMTESNSKLKSNYQNAVFLTTSLEKNGSFGEVIGSGETLVPIDRSCIYREMTYSNGFEEINRLLTINQYDIYAKFRTFGDSRLKPGTLLEIEDAKGLIKNVNVIDEVLNEYTQEQHFTHVFTFSNSKDLIDYEIDKIINGEDRNYPSKYGESDKSNYSNDDYGADFYASMRGENDNYDEVYQEDVEVTDPNG